MKFPVKEIKDIDLVFGGGAMKKLMPPYSSIPEEFRDGSNKWLTFQRDWFFSGIKNLKLSPKEGIDSAKAFRHLRAIQSAFEPKHEHKEAAVAYLASLWFDDVSYDKGERS